LSSEGEQMDNEQKKWEKKFWENFGIIEYLRLGCAIVIWNLLLIALSITIPSIFGRDSTVIIFSTIFFVTLFAFVLLTRRWRPAYLLFRKILGNKNLPAEPMPRSTIKMPRQPLPWYGYLPGIWGWLMVLALLSVIIRYLSK